MDRTKKVAAVVGAAAIVAALGACGSKNTPAAGNASSNYILGTTDSQVTSLDPAGAYDLPSWTLQYNIYQQLNLPRIPVKEGDIATGAIITLVVVLVGTLLAAVAGGKAGDRYHARVDALAWDRDRV